MGPSERSIADKAGKILAREFKQWAKDRYKNQRPTFKQYLKDVSSSPHWRSDWFDKFLGAVEKSFDAHIKEDVDFTPRPSNIKSSDVRTRMDTRSERPGTKAPKLGSGFFASVFQQDKDVQHALKVGDVVKTKNGDPYLMYLSKVVNLHNPYFPQVSELKVLERKNGPAVYKVRLEMLQAMQTLTEDEMDVIVSRIFGQQARKMYPRDLALWIDEAILEPDMWKSVQDTALVEALQIMHEIEKLGFFNDISINNMMVRRTKYGPQLVITDPFSD